MKRSRKRKVYWIQALLLSAGVLICLCCFHAARDGIRKKAPMSDWGLSKVWKQIPNEAVIPKEEECEMHIEQSDVDEIYLKDEDLTEYVVTDSQIQEILDSLTVEEKVAQMFFVTPESITGIENVTTAGEITWTALQKYPVGGLVYFSQNLVSEEQTREMLSNTQKYAVEKMKLPLFLGVDEEGGRVLRIGNSSGFDVERVAAMGILAQANDTVVIHDAADTIGDYLSDLGFNVDFAPDADVLTNAENRVIGDRSFGTDPDMVADMAWAYREGLHDNGILACYKHFPGHGGTVEDSHGGYAYSYKTLEELQVVELVPFRVGCERGIDFIMVSHISVPEVTGSDVPASLSEVLVTDVLRNEMGYRGIIITDSLGMGAVSNHYGSGEAAVMAVQAGCDMLLMPRDFAEAYEAVLDAVKSGTVAEEQIDASVSRIIKGKLKWEEGTAR